MLRIRNVGLIISILTASSPTLSDRSVYTNFFRTVSPDNFQAPAVARYMYSMGWRKAAVVAVNTAYGLDMATYFQKTCSQLGIQVLANIPYVDKRFLDKMYSHF
jgi:ABC-type branched-subunit amino acid transport system substrate-binding protein